MPCFRFLNLSRSTGIDCPPIWTGQLPFLAIVWDSTCAVIVPTHFTLARAHNLTVDAVEIVSFCCIRYSSSQSFTLCRRRTWSRTLGVYLNCILIKEIPASYYWLLPFYHFFKSHQISISFKPFDSSGWNFSESNIHTSKEVESVLSSLRVTSEQSSES